MERTYPVLAHSIYKSNYSHLSADDTLGRISCIGDLKLLIRAKPRLLLIALDTLHALPSLIHILRSVEQHLPPANIHIVASEDCVSALSAFSITLLDRHQFRSNPDYRDRTLAMLHRLSCDVVIQLDPTRCLEGDAILEALHPRFALGLEPPSSTDAAGGRAERSPFDLLLPRGTPPQELLQHLGLTPKAVTHLWPSPSLQYEMEGILTSLGDLPRLAYLVDHPTFLTEAKILAHLQEASRRGFHVLALGARAARQGAQGVLNTLTGPTTNLCGHLSLSSTLMLLTACVHTLGGTSTYRTLASCCGVLPAPPWSRSTSFRGAPRRRALLKIPSKASEAPFRKDERRG